MAYWCCVCGKRAAKPSTCEKCTMIVCDICKEDLRLLQRYDEWLQGYTNRVFRVEDDV